MNEGYRFAGSDTLRTPALLIYPDQVERNIAATLRLLGGDPGRWRPHLKTAKLAWTMERLRAAGVRQAKCATPLELDTACRAGFADVLLAYPSVGPAVALVREVAEAHAGVSISALVEDADSVAAWRGGKVGLFVDLNPGMNRTGSGLALERVSGIVRAIEAAGLRWAGLHYYDGHAAGATVAPGYAELLQLAEGLRARGLVAPELITAGTPAFPAATAYQELSRTGFLHRLSPGTVVYCDARSLTQLPAESGFGAAALVLTTVVSHPGGGRITCDAGHKTVSADAGDPTCLVQGHAAWTPRHPSEEHLPIDLPEGTEPPPRGTVLWLLPMHVCPTVNNFDSAVLVAGGRIAGVAEVTARGRHPPLE